MLTESSLESHWKAKGGPIHSVLNRMRKRQDWTVEQDGALQRWVEALGDKLAEGECIDAMVRDPKSTAEFLVWLSSPAALRILDVLDATHVGAAGDIIYQVESQVSNPVHRLFVEGLVVIAKSRLLAAAFAPERFKAVATAVDAANLNIQLTRLGRS